MRLLNRPALVRMAKIDAEIRAGRRPNATTLAKLLEVNPRTIQRDLGCLRDQLGAPIDYDIHRRGFFYTDATYRLALPQISEGECLALFLAERLLQQYRGLPCTADLRRLFQKITTLLPDGISLHVDQLSQAYAVHTQSADPGDADRFRALVRAIERGRQLDLLYWSASRDQTVRRVVDPYHLALVENEWYLIGHCHLREDVRMFAPSRIRELRETGTLIERPPDFRITDYLDAGFRKMRGAGPAQTVRLRLAPTAARFVREKTWHASQKIDEEPDDGLVLTMRVNHLAEVKRWVMSFGAECEVLVPDELKQDIISEIDRMRKLSHVSHNCPKE